MSEVNQENKIESTYEEAFNYAKMLGVAAGTVLAGVLLMAPFIGKTKEQARHELISSKNPVQVFQDMKAEIQNNPQVPEEIKEKVNQIEEKIEKEISPVEEKPNTTEKDIQNYNTTVARIIYSEASPIVSDYERELVASVIMNRINHRGFEMGKLKSMQDVVMQHNAFEALNDPRNKNWKATETPETLPSSARHAWIHSLELSTGNFKPVSGESKRPLVYYHDKSISLPKSWNNKYWGVIKELTTEHFIFYSVYPK